ncbi:hypothetical protein E2C01_079808 [Portunus trituberculatus]|uniref:Uncharacterized protein n=1 Tax=Portunus trituberculatus TaxID=210409 RepID=A0A5B7IKH6_PORTR|nr:hypothetical protein [Portunus trituberculatus]
MFSLVSAPFATYDVRRQSLILMGAKAPLRHLRLATSPSFRPQDTHGGLITPLSHVGSDNSSRVWIRFNAHLRALGGQAPQIAPEHLFLYACRSHCGIISAVSDDSEAKLELMLISRRRTAGVPEPCNSSRAVAATAHEEASTPLLQQYIPLCVASERPHVVEDKPIHLSAKLSVFIPPHISLFPPLVASPLTTPNGESCRIEDYWP